MDNDPWDLQTGHDTHTAGTVYPRELMEGSNVVTSHREQFRQVSITWPKYFEFRSAETMDSTQKRKRPLDDDIQHAQMARWKRLQTVESEKR